MTTHMGFSFKLYPSFAQHLLQYFNFFNVQTWNYFLIIFTMMLFIMHVLHFV